MKTKKRWYDYLWIFSATYLILGFFNILFAWLGMICFITPLLIAILGGSKAYCNRYCGRSQLFDLIGGKLGISLNRPAPLWMRTNWWRYGFLVFFMTMFGIMVFQTVQMAIHAGDVSQFVTLLWTFHLPWNFAYHGTLFAPWVAQFSFGFYSVMLTSTVLGLLMMVFFKPRAWCVYCPMGTMTQGICKLKAR